MRRKLLESDSPTAMKWDRRPTAASAACWFRRRGRPERLLPTVALVVVLVSTGVAGFDEYTACARPSSSGPAGRSHFSAAGRPPPTPPPPCDFRKQSWCAIPGSGYPWHAVRQFVHENQGLMRRMYGEVRQISVLQAELSSNEVTEFDIKSTGRADGSDVLDFDLHALQEAAVVKYTAAMPAKSKGVKVRKGGAKRGGESSHVNKMVDSSLKVADGSSKGGESAAAVKVDDVRLKEGGTKTQSILTSLDKGTKVPASTAAGLEETIWQSDYSSFEVPTTVVSTLSPDSSPPTSSESMDGSQVESSSKAYDQDILSVFETTTMDAPGTTYMDPEISSPAFKEGSMTPGTPHTVTPYPQFNFYGPAVASPTTDSAPSSTYEKATVVEEFHQEKLFQDVVKEEKEGGEELITGMLDDEGMMVAANASTYDEGLDMKDDEEEEDENTALSEDEDDFMSTEEEDDDLTGYPSGSKVPPSTKLRGVNACPVKEEVVAPFWANNTRGEMLALLNLYPFEQYVHWEKCTFEHRQMFCREGCRCEQQYRLHRLLAYDPRNECRGIFSDWFKFPSCCVCMCYNLPSELRHTSRSPRNQHDIGSTETSVSEHEVTYEEKHFERNEGPSSENASIAEESIEVRLLGESSDMSKKEPGTVAGDPDVPSNSASATKSFGSLPRMSPLHFYYYYNQHQLNPPLSSELEEKIVKLPLPKNTHVENDSVSVQI
ncbi:protein spaetzle 4 [Ischnura elegans]|uniref:protein spaetzle 4 n=1 Tax=Ischnura elegans TaxID=197161 RepID=UPI001ED89E20|nr:protein spaetzle 4 [Ischnura elegans]